MHKQDVALLILLDLSCAYETTDHGMMAQILGDEFGVSDRALCWVSPSLLLGGNV